MMFHFSFEAWLNPLPVDFGGLLCGLSHVHSRCHQQTSVTQLLDNIDGLKQRPSLNNSCVFLGELVGFEPLMYKRTYFTLQV